MRGCLAAVRPRVRRDDGVESLFLEEEIADLLAAGERGWVGLVAPEGAGRTTTLEHLAAVFAGDSRLSLTDGPPGRLDSDPSDPMETLAVYADDTIAKIEERHVYYLAPWDEDDRVEYLLARAPNRCASVMARLKDSGTASALLAQPATCVLILDALAADDSVANAADAVHRVIETKSPPRFADELAEFCLRDACGIPHAAWTRTRRYSMDEPWTAPILPLVRDGTARQLLAARVLATVLARGRLPFRTRPPRDLTLLPSVAERLRGRSDAFAHVESRLDDAPRVWQSFLASLLLALDENWQPGYVTLEYLQGARLSGAKWPGIRLPVAYLQYADLSNADLSGAVLDEGTADAARFVGTCLVSTSLQHLAASKASFARADLTDARFDHARLADADFSDTHAERTSFAFASLPRADFSRARLMGASLNLTTLDDAKFDEADLRLVHAEHARARRVDFRHTSLDGADFSRADLSGARLDELLWPGARLRSALLDDASLTGARMPGAQLEGASLVGAHLADVDLSGANLQNADLRRATFHMGSSRSGLIFSPIASEGTRTGFYTDDSVEMSTIDPDQVRNADLRGADLRGAKLDGADFFLVDLRGAQLDRSAIPLLRSMRAILDRPDPS